MAELDERLSSAEFAEWVALLAVEPWGPYRDDYHGAVTAWANLAPWDKSIEPKDFFPKWAKSEKFQEGMSLDQQAEFIRLITGVANGQ